LLLLSTNATFDRVLLLRFLFLIACFNEGSKKLLPAVGVLNIKILSHKYNYRADLRAMDLPHVFKVLCKKCAIVFRDTSDLIPALIGVKAQLLLLEV
jgi:hypothetical protein